MNQKNSIEEQLFAEALARPSAQRAAFLDTACAGDAELRRRIETLLIAHEAPEGVLPLPFAPGLALRRGETAGTVIARYTLRKKIGEGGCGTVWLAEQEDPVRRQVALKVIKAGMDTREVVARFAAERQALAIMDHPGIAKVLDAGATPAGLPFFVMDLVRGTRITDHCDELRLPLSARLELFIQVCHAIQHAHQKGVIHRDLKPSNILVTQPENGGPGQVKVIDFGIAKATQGRLADGTVVTAFEQFIGTPAYMSPEQADTSGMDVDTRSDVYSLGVLLYELLTGGPPFDPKSLSQLSRDQIRRLIRDVDPPKPSTRFANLPVAEREKLARLRGTDPARWSQVLAGDLDWIVMKAIEKSRVRRYETTTALAADIGHHLNHEPVTARPPSATYRVGKLVRRNRLAFAAGTLVALTLVAGTVFSAWQRMRAMEERARAEDLLDFMLGDLREQLAKVGRLDLLEGIGNKSLAYIASVEGSDVTDATLTRHAKILEQLGGIRVDQARYQEAQQFFSAAYARTAAVAARNPKDSEVLFIRGKAEFGNALVHWKRAELDAANDWLTRYRRTAVALVERDPKSLRFQRELVSSHHSIAAFETQRGRLEIARQSFTAELAALRRLIALQPRDYDLQLQLADATSWLGTIAERSGDLRGALRHYSAQTTQMEAICRSDPAVDHWQFRLADALSFQAGASFILGERDAARQGLNRAQTIMKRLVEKDPPNRRWRHLMSGLMLKQAIVAAAAGEHGSAVELIATAIPACEDVWRADPSNRTFTARLAMVLRWEATLRRVSDPRAAAEAAERAVQLGETLVRHGRAIASDIGECAQAHIAAGLVVATHGDRGAARRHWQRARELLAPIIAGSRDWCVLDPAVRAAALLGNSTEAQALITQLSGIGYIAGERWPAAENLGITTLENQ